MSTPFSWDDWRIEQKLRAELKECRAELTHGNPFGFSCEHCGHHEDTAPEYSCSECGCGLCSVCDMAHDGGDGLSCARLMAGEAHCTPQDVKK